MTGPSSGVFGDQEVALVDLLDRLLAGGVVLTGDLTISLAGVDLVRLSLRALLVSIGADESRPPPPGGPGEPGPAALGAGPVVPEVPG
ncbi:gas vesicle protein GvpA/GvpJ/GvpM family [Pseudonocardia sediminis]|uniref:Gas vesicle protein GvpA/GvpJ/GvpM family n=1 Tax=Pseudonocardia sediminis TaxID=1397368 RepID=A0A4Q7UXS0_PSEST|nr:gas vesicle protein [Pseudonocardia sediminis]RZT86877.1 gas vesicle protein GvpA/GvpJ/GvpM family [Pseudonocardia sediminis]